MQTRKKLNLVRNLFGLRFLGTANPFWAQIRLTDKCNQDCVYCNIGERGSKGLSKEQVFSLVDQIRNDCFFITLSGGEPLIRNDIGEIIDHIKKDDGIFLSLLTNGTMLEKRLDSVRKVDVVVISMDGPEDLHDKQKGPGTFVKVRDALRIARANELNFFVSCVLTKNNIREIGRIIDEFRGLGATAWFAPVVDYPLAKDHLESIIPSREELRTGFDLLIEEKKKGLPILNSLPCLKFLKEGRTIKRSECKAGLSFCEVDVDGNVCLCGRTIASHDNNFLTNGFKEAFYHLRGQDCPSCNSPCYIEANLLSSLNKDVVLSHLKKRMLLP